MRTGSAYTLELRDDFLTSNGGILDVKLCNTINCTDASNLNLGSIQSRSGRQTYVLGSDGSQWAYVVIYCRVVNVAFGYGLLK